MPSDDGHAINSSRGVAVLCAVLAWLAVGMAAYLLKNSLAGDALPGCGGAEGCAELVTGPWARVWGIPVSAGAVVVYGMMGILCLNSQRQRWAWAPLFLLSAMALGSAAWFIYLQHGVIHRTCMHCNTVHSLGALAAVMILLTTPYRHPGRALGVMALGLTLVLALATAQWNQPRPSAGLTARETPMLGGRVDIDTGPGPGREITILGGMVRLRPHEQPTLGSADAEKIVVLAGDYTCFYCRQMHDMLLQAQEHLGPGKLGIVFLPIPIDAKCNARYRETPAVHENACELARLALAVWKADPAQFKVFDAWLYAPETPRTLDAARAQAEGLIGRDKLEAVLHEGWPSRQIHNNTELHRLAKFERFPTVISGASMVSGIPAETAEMIRWLEEALAMKK